MSCWNRTGVVQAVYHYNVGDQVVVSIGAVDGGFGKPFVIVGQTDERKGISAFRQTSDHKNEFKY